MPKKYRPELQEHNTLWSHQNRFSRLHRLVSCSFEGHKKRDTCAFAFNIAYLVGISYCEHISHDRLRKMGQKQGKEKRPSVAGAKKRPSEAAKMKRPSETSDAAQTNDTQQSGLTRKTSMQQAGELNVYVKPRQHGGSVAKRKASSTSEKEGLHRKNSSQSSANKMLGAGDAISEDVSQQRKPLFDHLVAFYFRNDHDRLLNGDVDVDGICDWALNGGAEGIASLNEKLRNKYGEDLDSFLLNAATETKEGDDEDEDDEPSVEIVPNRTPSAEPIKEEGHTISETRRPSNLGNDAAFERPAIPTPRRRPTNTMRFTLDENGQINIPESAQLDHAAPPTLEVQIRNLIESVDPSRVGEVDRFTNFAQDYGLVALNSELMVAFGRDLKGNLLNSEDQEPGEGGAGVDVVKKFGVGFDNKVLSEMQGHKLHHEDSGRVNVAVDPDTGACNRFRLDTESPVFGMCKCGKDRAAHIKSVSSIKSNTLERKLAQRRASMNTEAVKEQPHSKQYHIAEVEVPQVESQAPPPLLPASTPVKAAALPPRTIATSTSSSSSTTHSEVATPRHNETGLEVKPKPPTPSSIANNPVRPKSVRRRPPSGKKADSHSLERLKPGEKKPKPCSIEEFQLDMSANVFGVCLKCGWKKQDHHPGSSVGVTAEAASNGSPASVVPKRPISLRKDGPSEPCNNYRLDLTADTFGACVCGFARQAHVGQKSQQKAVSSTLERRWAHLKEVA